MKVIRTPLLTAVATAALAAGVLAPARSARGADVNAPAAATPAAPAAPATKDEIRKLVAQLGDGDYAARDRAAKRLRSIGRPALGELKRAIDANADAEVVSRAQALVRRIETRPVPGGDPTVDTGEPAEPPRTRDVLVDGDRIIEVVEADRQTRIVEGEEGIVMTVTGQLDGEQTTEEYTAKTPSQLKREYPQAFTLYLRCGGGLNNAVFRGPGAMQINGGRIAFNAAGEVAKNPDEIDILRSRLEKQMRVAQLTDEQRADVHQAIVKLAESRPSLTDPNTEKYILQCDEFRETAAKYKLQVGNLLPPPAKTRLGVAIETTEGRLVVKSVAPDSRAEHIGLKPGDQILSMDGKDVTSVGELRTAAEAKGKGLVIEIERADEKVKLEEPQPKADAK